MQALGDHAETFLNSNQEQNGAKHQAIQHSSYTTEENVGFCKGRGSVKVILQLVPSSSSAVWKDRNDQYQ